MPRLPYGTQLPVPCGAPQLLPLGHAVSSMYHYTGAVDLPLPDRSLKRHGKASPRYGILLIALCLAVGCKLIFRLTTMWMHPHQVCLPTLANVAQRLLLLADKGAEWPYAYTRMSNAMAHVPLSSERHIGIMTGDLPNQNTCSHLHQLCVWQLLQCGGWVVCLDGLNGRLEPLMFNFKEVPLWNMVNAGKSSRDPSMMDVDLGDMVYGASPSTQVESPLSLSERGMMEQLPLAFLATPSLPHNTSTPGHKHH